MTASIQTALSSNAEAQRLSRQQDVRQSAAPPAASAPSFAALLSDANSAPATIAATFAETGVFGRQMQYAAPTAQFDLRQRPHDRLTVSDEAPAAHQDRHNPDEPASHALAASRSPRESAALQLSSYRGRQELGFSQPLSLHFAHAEASKGDDAQSSSPLGRARSAAKAIEARAKPGGVFVALHAAEAGPVVFARVGGLEDAPLARLRQAMSALLAAHGFTSATIKIAGREGVDAHQGGGDG